MTHLFQGCVTVTIVGAVCGTVKNNFVLNMYLETFDKVCVFVVYDSKKSDSYRQREHVCVCV